MPDAVPGSPAPAPFGLVVRFELHPGQEAAFDDLVSRTVRAIAEHEPGTLVYATHTVAGSPSSRVFYELYADRAAFDAHEQTEHTRAFLAERQRFVASFEVAFLGPGVSSIR